MKDQIYKLFCTFGNLSLVAVVFVSCSLSGSKQSEIEKLNTLVGKVKESGSNYTVQEWASADSSFRLITSNIKEKYQDNLTSEELNNIGKLKGAYYAFRAKAFSKDIMNSIKNAATESQGIIDGVINGMKEDRADSSQE